MIFPSISERSVDPGCPNLNDGSVLPAHLPPCHAGCRCIPVVTFHLFFPSHHSKPLKLLHSDASGENLGETLKKHNSVNSSGLDCYLCRKSLVPLLSNSSCHFLISNAAFLYSDFPRLLVYPGAWVIQNLFRAGLWCSDGQQGSPLPSR
jgi:hypothetical protein